MEEKQLNMPDEHPVPKKKRKGKAGRILLLLILIQFFGWLAAFVEIVANGCAGDKDKNKQKQNASGLSFSFFLRNRVFIWHPEP